MVAKVARALTKAAVNKLKPTGKRPPYKIRDSEARGLMVCVNRTSVTWAVQWDERTGGKVVTRKKALGTVQRVGIERAREAARTARAGQPAEVVRAQGTGAGTLAAAWELYEARLHKRARSPRTIRYFNDMLAYLPDWQNRSLEEIGADRTGIARLHEELSDVRGKIIANRVLGALRSAYRHASRMWPHLPPHPVVAVEFNREEKRGHALMPAQLPVWWAMTAALSNPVRRDLHRFMLLTGMRKSAAMAVRVSDFYPEINRLHVPLPKGGSKAKFDLPLGPWLTSMLAARVADNDRASGRLDCPWLFPANSASGHVYDIREDTVVDPEAGESWVGDILRASYQTFAENAEVPDNARAFLVNHGVSGLRAHYIKADPLWEHLQRQQIKVETLILIKSGIVTV